MLGLPAPYRTPGQYCLTPKFLKLENRRKRLGVKRATTRLKISILRVKWLQELKQEENIVILLRFKERYIKGCYKIALKRYYIKDKPITLTIIY